MINAKFSQQSLKELFLSLAFLGHMVLTRFKEPNYFSSSERNIKLFEETSDIFLYYFFYLCKLILNYYKRKSNIKIFFFSIDVVILYVK